MRAGLLAPKLLGQALVRFETTLKTLLMLVTSAVVAAAACSSSKVSTAPSPVKCEVSLTALQTSIAAGGGAGSVTVTTSAECAWTAAADVNWITGLSPASGQGNGEVRFQVAANPATSARQGRITLNSVAAQVNQAGVSCRVEISPPSQAIDASGGSGTVQVTTPGSCAWTTSTSAPWLTVTSGASGTGNGTVSYTVGANTGVARLAVLTISDQTFAVTQAAPGAPQCNYSIQETSVTVPATGGSAVVNVQADPSCSWTAASNVAWVAVSGIGVGSGNGSVTINVSPNTGAARSGTVTIAGRTLAVNQAVSCLGSLNPTSALIAAGGGAGPSIAVTVAAGCGWTASTTDAWLSITQGASGTGNGTVAFSASANPGPARTGSLAIAGQTFGVTQPSCALSLNLPSQSLPATAGAGSPINVSAVGGCNWTASASVPWITITGGASGVGNGSVTFSVTANSGSGRTGTITIGSQAHTVTQAGSCSISIAPPSQTVPAAGGTATSVTVTAALGCNWTAVPSQGWLTVISGASGAGNGTVGLSAEANIGPDRSATVTIAGQIHTVTQTSGCTYSLNPTNHALDKNPQTPPAIAVNTTSGCFWTAVSNDAWIIVESGASGSGPGTVTYRVTNNNGNGPRTGTLTIAGRTFTVVQNNNEPD